MTENAPEYQEKAIDQLSMDELYMLLSIIEQKHDLVFSVWSKQDIHTVFTEEGKTEEQAEKITDVFWSENNKTEFSDYLNHRDVVLNYYRQNITHLSE
jgi:hypothetical protein